MGEKEQSRGEELVRAGSGGGGGAGGIAVNEEGVERFGSGPRQTTSTDGSRMHSSDSPLRETLSGRFAGGDDDGDGIAIGEEGVQRIRESPSKASTGRVAADDGDGIAIDEEGHQRIRESPSKASTGRVIGPDMEPDMATDLAVGDEGVTGDVPRKKPNT